MKKRIVSLLLLGLCVGLFLYNLSLRAPETEGTNTSSATDTATGTTGTAAASTGQPQPAAGQVWMLNSDPSRQAAWEALAAEYTRQTGVAVTIVSADSAMLCDEDAEVPTLFTVRDAEELEQWKDLCLDLSGADAYAQLSSWALTLQSDGKVCGIAAEMDAYGLIYNCTLLAQVGRSRSDITGFAKLKEVAESITADDSLGFAAFASPDLDGDFAAGLAALPGDWRSFLDLYLANTGNVTAGDSAQELLDGKAVFCIGSTREYETLSALGDHQLDIMPLYIGLENEGQQSLCVMGSSYWCVRNDTSEQDIQAALDFLSYLVHPREDGTVPVDDLGLLAPYRQAAYAGNALEKVLRTDLAAGKEYLVCADLSAAPADLAETLEAYAAAPTDENWAKVTAAMGK